MFYLNKFLSFLIFIIIPSSFINAQFLDSFDNKNIECWFAFTGDGNAAVELVQKDGYARMLVDATKDKYNVYWATIKRDITGFIDLSKFKNHEYLLRVEAQVKISAAPRRVNFMVNTQRTTDFHLDLMEFDIPDTSNWYTISMTAKYLNAIPGDTVYVQLCATDFGYDKYHVDIDYYRADIININEVGPEKGMLVPYHPPIPDTSTFSNHLTAKENGMINKNFPDVNFSNLQIITNNGDKKILTVSTDQWILLRWDFSKFKNYAIESAGILELTTQSLIKGGQYIEAYGKEFGMEFGKIRIIEILDSDTRWTEEKVTYKSFLNNKELYDVINGQMIIDEEVSEKPGSKNFITISKPVLQRLLDGKTKGLLIRPLGAIIASFYTIDDDERAPKLHFNIK